MASSSSQPVTAADMKKYDVFISFRGDDTRAGFTSHLHAALKRKYLETYIDYKIEKGSQVWAELETAIRDSTLFLVVFSENYADSTWCLNELVEIMECSNKNVDNVVVIPVFYQIDPSHVRKQTGSYGTALSKHKNQGNIDDKTVQNWKKALSKTANLSGFHSTTYGTESVLIEDITRVVLEKLNRNYKNELTCNIILDENYHTIQSLIKKKDSREVQIIGLCGMGGIGKTTLATAMFNKICYQYEGICFLDNVTEVSNMYGIHHTCNRLLSKLLREELDIDTSKVIPSTIIRRLKRMKSLIVLDDVRTLELLQNLIGVGNGWLGAGSTVIITTRDKHVLISGGIQKIHQVKKMNSQNSLQLFSLNAFHNVVPNEGYEELSERAIDYAEGNPLALKVLGSFLCRKSEIEWNCALAKLKEVPNAKIDKILRWSYDELDDKEKNIFLDIAFVFKGFKRDRVTKILNECGFFADIGISRLLDKDLIRVDFKNCIQMHDLIQEMGKQIVLEEFPKNPEQRSRLCDPKEVCDILKNNRGTKSVEVIILDANEYTNISVSPRAFEKMVNLRLLAFRDNNGMKFVTLPQGLDLLPENLRYFSWDGYPLKSLPPTFSSNMLVELYLQESRVEKLWTGEMNLPNLETLDLTGSKRLIECPNVSGSPNLKFLTLNYCESMPEVDPSIFLLEKLVSLMMYGCTSVKTLSSNTCSPALVELSVVDCINLQEFSVTFSSTDRLVLELSDWKGNELPSSILNRKNLHSFQFPMIECLVDLSENFADSIMLLSPPNCEHDLSITLHKVLSSPAFISLKHLILFDIRRLSEIPDNISLLSSLNNLLLVDIGIRSLPESIKYLPQLFRLTILHCTMLQSIPTLPPNLIDFTVWDCESLETVLNLNSMGEPYDKPNPYTVFFEESKLAHTNWTNPYTVVLLNCKNLDPHSCHTVLKDATAGIELRARRVLNSTNEEDHTFQYLLPVMEGIEYWFDYTSTQVSFTLELPPNLLGFAYYLVLSQGSVGGGTGFGCECYLDNISGERICITSSPTANIFEFPGFGEILIPIISDHVVFWYDPVTCKQIMEAVDDVNSTSYSPKLTFKFFIDPSETVLIKECGFHWICEEETVSSTIFESHDEDEETVPPTTKLMQRIYGRTPMASLELDETKGLRYLLEEH